MRTAADRPHLRTTRKIGFYNTMSGLPNGVHSNGSSSHLPADDQIFGSNPTEQDIRLWARGHLPAPTQIRRYNATEEDIRLWSHLPAPTQILRSNAIEEDMRPCDCLVNYFDYNCGCPSPRADYTILACPRHAHMTVGDLLSETFLEHRRQLISRRRRTWQAQNSSRNLVLGYNCPLHGGPAAGTVDE